MDTQIIISREDNTDFVSLGFIQTDTSLVTALGGALASFAEEIGLSGGTVENSEQSNKINFSKFQNGVLASKMVQVGEHHPIILIAIKEFGGAERDLDFIVDYAEMLAADIVSAFESDYSSIGFVPKIEQALEVIIKVATKIQKQSGDKARLFTKHFKPKIAALLDELWESQSDIEHWSDMFSAENFYQLTTSQLQKEIAKYFYITGVKSDALFPLVFATHSDPVSEVSKLLGSFLRKKAKSARVEIVSEIKRIIGQLRDSSKSLSQKGAMDIPEVDLLNEDLLFEKLLVSKKDSLPKVSSELEQIITKDLYKRLAKKFPLKFLAMSQDSPFELSHLSKIVKDSLNELLVKELQDKSWISSNLLQILRDVSSKFSPEDMVQKREQLIETILDEFIQNVKRMHPFVVLAEPTLEQINTVARRLTEDVIETFRTSYDEAVVLSAVIGQIHSKISSDRSGLIHDSLIVYFLDSVIRPYQSRDVPEIVYALIVECLKTTANGKNKQVVDIVNESMTQLEKKLEFKIIPETKKQVSSRLSKAKARAQTFENFENLSFFFQSYRRSLENTLTKILQTVFGTEKWPSIPLDMSRQINKFIAEVQNIFVLSRAVEIICKRSGGRELTTNEATNLLEKNTSFKYILPTPLELAREACKQGWMKSGGKYKKGLSKTALKALAVEIPSLNYSGKIKELLQNPAVLVALWTKYAGKIIESRQNELKQVVADFERKSKISAGSTSGRKKYSMIARKLRRLSRSLGNLVSGGGFMRKIFGGKKDLSQAIGEANAEYYQGFNFNPKEHSLDPRVFYDSGDFLAIDPMIGDFQDLMKVYASIWVADSAYIASIEDQLFWKGLTSSVNNGSPLERKIIKNLRNNYKKKRGRGKKAVIRSTVTEAVVPLFNQSVRLAMAKGFDIFKNERVIRYDKSKKEWYISLGKVDASKKLLAKVFGSIKNIKLTKTKDDRISIDYLLSDYSASKRSKESQSMQVFLRRASYNDLVRRELRALKFFGDLNETYIGKSAADTFYSYTRLLAQIIISPIEEK